MVLEERIGLIARLGLCGALLVLVSCGGGSDDAVGARSFDVTTTSTVASPEVTAAPSTDPAASDEPGEQRSVSGVIDGDTIVVDGDEHVRLIGVDTPETKDPRKPVQCFGREASDFTTSLLPAGTSVRLVYDVERRDRYGRTLAYVYRAKDGLFVNATLARDGYAVSATYPPDVAHAEEFVQLANHARAAGRGLWTACDTAADPPTTTSTVAVRAIAATPAPLAARVTDSDCDPSYPTVCIPSGPPDLDCPDVPYRRFEVRSPDPHGFDRDHDGVGCES